MSSLEQVKIKFKKIKLFSHFSDFSIIYTKFRYILIFHYILVIFLKISASFPEKLPIHTGFSFSIFLNLAVARWAKNSLIKTA